MPFSLSSVDRPLRLKARADIVAAAVSAGNGRWVVTDPVTRTHFELTNEEHALLTWLDDRVSLRELQRRFERRFAPLRVEPQQLWTYLSRLHRDGLVFGSATGQGDELWRRDRDRRDHQTRWAWTRLLAIRLPSVDPDRFITALYGLVGWLFHPWGLLAALLVVLTGGAVAVANASHIAADLPDLATLAQPSNLLWLAATAVLVKVLHELGHALTCKHFGGEVREMGVLLLAFAPCLYCDVSDMWRMPSRARRMAVSAAGMATELVLAALAVIAWRFAEPGVVRSCALSVVMVCTVGTLLVNANPLLRFDGYYLLADLTGTSNLWQRSRDAVRAWLARWFLRRNRDENDPERPPLWLTAYGLASQAYLVLIVSTVLWLLAATLRPMHLESVAWAVGAMCVAGVAAGPIRGAVRWGRDPASAARLRRVRATWALVGLTAALAILLQAPRSYTVEAPAVAVLDNARPVVATVEGRLIEARLPGDLVSQGDVVARLANPAIEGELVELEGRVAEQQALVTRLEAMRGRDADANDRLPAERGLLADLRRRLADRRADAERLTLRAQRDGVVIAPPKTHAEPDPTTLPAWHGSPLEPRNLGAWIEVGARVAIVGDPGEISVQAALDEVDIERLAEGQTARVALVQTPGVVLHGEVTEVARDASPRDSQRAANQAALTNWSPLQPPAARPGARYQVRVSLAQHDSPLLVGGAGRVKIDTGRTTLGRWLADGIRQTFRLP